MSDHERGAYTPQPDAPLSFNSRASREGQPLPLALIASCIVLATLIVALFMFYQSGMRKASDVPPPVGTPVDQFRSPPPANGQASEGLKVVAAAPPTEPLPLPPGVTEKPVERGPTVPVPVQSPPSTATALVPQPSVPAPTHSDPVGVLLDTSKAAKLTKLAEVKPLKPVTAPVAVVVPSTEPAVASGAAVVQIGAYLSQAQATEAWHRVSGLMGGESSGRGRHIEPVEANGSTRYRSQFTGFASRTDAAKFCATLKAKGQDCIVKSAN